MANKIHPTAVVGKGVQLGDGNDIGPGCVIEDGVLIGIGARILSGARVGKYSLIGAGAIVLENAVIPERSLVLGVPGKVVRQLTPQEIAVNVPWAKRYRELAVVYRKYLG